MSSKSVSCPALVLCPQREQEDDIVTSHHTVFESIDQVPWSELWALIPLDRHLLRYDYLRALETTHPDMSFRYVILYKNDRAIGFAYFQIITLEWTRLQIDRSNGSRKWLNQIRQTAFKSLLGPQASVLLLGNIFITGDFAFHTEGISREETLNHLMTAAQNIQKKDKRIIGTLFKDFRTKDDIVLSRKGFNRFAVDPNMVLKIQSHWQHLDDYAADMTSKYRQRMKSAYKKSKHLEVRDLSLEEVKAYRDDMHTLFEQMIQDETFNFKEISPTYFIDLKAELGQAFPVRAYFEGDEMVAFYTCLSDRHRMEAHYVGFDIAKNRSQKLYQRMLYDLVDEAISKEAREISFGRTAMEIKSCIGARAEDYGIFLKISNSFINRLVGPNIRNIKPDLWQPRQPFKEGYQTLTSPKKHSLQRGS